MSISKTPFYVQIAEFVRTWVKRAVVTSLQSSRLDERLRTKALRSELAYRRPLHLPTRSGKERLAEQYFSYSHFDHRGEAVKIWYT